MRLVLRVVVHRDHLPPPIRSPRRQRAGRIVGVAGAAVASVFWGVFVIIGLGTLMSARGLEALAAVLIVPATVVASVLFVVSFLDVAVLARRVDTGMPWRVGGTHLATTVLILYVGRTEALAAALVPLAIAVTQFVALWLFQMTPSHASSQR